MANRYGFEIETPQEVQARIQAQITRLRQQNPQAADSQMVINALFGNPALRQAQESQDALSQAISNVTKGEEDSEIEFQIKQNQAVRSAMAGVNPEVALQANDNLLRLQSERLELDSLRMRRDVDKQALETAQQLALDRKTPTIFQYDPKTGQKRGVRRLNPEMSVKEVNAILANIQETDPENSYTVGNASELFQTEDFKDGSVFKGLNKSAIGRIRNQIKDTADLKFKTNQFVTKMIEAPLALLPTSPVEARSGALLTALRKVGGDFIQSAFQADEELKVAERWLGDESGFASRVESMGIEAGIARGLVLDMAYSLAKSKDSGRLSDKDVDMAIKMLTGEGNPNEILSLLRLQMEAAAYGARHYKEGVYNGTYGEDAIGMYESFEEQDRLLQEKLNRFEEILKAGGLIKYHQSAFGESSLYKKQKPKPSGSDPQNVSDQAPGPIEFTITEVGPNR